MGGAGGADTPPPPSRPAAPFGSGSSGGGAGGRGRRRVNVVEFFRDVRSELRKVVWPTPTETRNLTIVVLSMAVVLSVFLGGVDFIFQELFRFLLNLGG